MEVPLYSGLSWTPQPVLRRADGAQGCHHNWKGEGECPKCRTSPMHKDNMTDPFPHNTVLMTKGGIQRQVTPAEAQKYAGFLYWPDDPRMEELYDAAKKGNAPGTGFTNYALRSGMKEERPADKGPSQKLKVTRATD